jgi:hypothetical protein
MSIDVVDLRNFYAQRLGVVALICRASTRRWFKAAAEAPAAQPGGTETVCIPTAECRDYFADLEIIT